MDCSLISLMIKISRLTNLVILGSRLAIVDFMRGGYTNTNFKSNTESIKKTERCAQNILSGKPKNQLTPTKQ
jgi:hypothetical protein